MDNEIATSEADTFCKILINSNYALRSESSSDSDEESKLVLFELEDIQTKCVNKNQIVVKELKPEPQLSKPMLPALKTAMDPSASSNARLLYYIIHNPPGTDDKGPNNTSLLYHRKENMPPADDKGLEQQSSGLGNWLSFRKIFRTVFQKFFRGDTHSRK